MSASYRLVNTQLPIWEEAEWTVKTKVVHYQGDLGLEDTSLTHYRAVAEPHLRACRGIIATYNFIAYTLEHGDLTDLVE